MRKLRLGIYIGDAIYRERFCRYLMNYYMDRLELAIYTDREEISTEQMKNQDLWILEGISEEEAGFAEEFSFSGKNILYLNHSRAGIPEKLTGEKVQIVDKYMDVGHIVDLIMRQNGGEVCESRSCYRAGLKNELIGVYGLSGNEFQLPFAVTLGAVIGEKRHVLLLDLQENSGISHMLGEKNAGSLEDLLVMAADGKYVKSKIRSCIGHLDHLDCVFPAKNPESLSGVDADLYLNLIQMLFQELDYSAIIINFGSRFPGFFKLWEKSRNIWIPERKSLTGEFRKREFMDEMEEQNGLKSKLIPVEIAVQNVGNVLPERLIEQWRWNNMGSYIRKFALEESSVG